VTICAVTTLYHMKEDLVRGFHYCIDPTFRPNKVTDPAWGKRGARRADAEEINRLAVPWLRSLRGERFFLFVHYWDPHTPYRPPAEYRNRWYKGDPADPRHHYLDDLKRRLDGKYPPEIAERLFLAAKTRMGAGALGVETTDIGYVAAQHDGEITYTDDKVAELLGAVEDLGLMEETLVIITGDHGECIDEHDCFSDHGNVYEQTIHVPLIMVYPGAFPRGKRVQAFVQQIDIFPTIMELMGIPPPRGLEGRSLMPLIRGETDRGHEAIICNQGLWQASRAIRVGDWKFIDIIDRGFWGAESAYELYNLRKDPGEENDLIEEEPEVAARLQVRLDRWVHERIARRPDRTDPLRLNFTRTTSPLLRYHTGTRPFTIGGAERPGRPGGRPSPPGARRRR